MNRAAELTGSVAEDIIAAEVHMQIKDISRIMHVLANIGIVRTHSRTELKDGKEKSSARSWYYVDPIRMINSIKWRMYELRHSIDDKAKDARRRLSPSDAHRRSRHKASSVRSASTPIRIWIRYICSPTIEASSARIATRC